MRNTLASLVGLVLLSTFAGQAAPTQKHATTPGSGTVIVDDTFANGNSQLQDLSNNSLFLYNGRTTTVRTDQVGSVTFDVTPTGGSSEGFWAFFTPSGSPVTLGVGDKLTVSNTFTMTGFLANGQDIRWGVFDSLGTRNTANLASGMNDPSFVNDPGYGLDLFPSGVGNPFVIGRRATLGNANVFNNFGDFATINGTGATTRQTLTDGTAYTLTFTIQRLSATQTQLTSTVSGGNLTSDFTYTSVETNPNPQTTFDYFAFRIAGTSFASKISFSELAVTYLPAAPAITVQPQPGALTVQVGNNVSITIAASGSALSYQWQKNGQPITNNPSALTATLTLTGVALTDAGSYTAVITNSGGTVTSNPVVVNVSTSPVPPAPTISSQPQNTVATLGAAATLTVAANGNGLSYQWYKNGAAIPGATSSSLQFPSAAITDDGAYTVLVSNSSGSILSGAAQLLVVSTVSATSFQPLGTSASVCNDTSLSVSFNQAVTLGKSGRLLIYNSAGSLVDTIDTSTNPQTRLIGGNSFVYFPVTLNGNTATIYLHQPLAYNDSYSVVVEPGVFLDANGAPFAGVSDRTQWTFTTKATGPASGLSAITVAKDGTGDFCMIQSAVDYVPANNSSRVVITVKRGIYPEEIYVGVTKPFITIRGEDRDGSKIEFADNANLNGGFSRIMVGVDASDFTLEDITLHNSTPRGGSQAEALHTNNNHTLINRVNLNSFQDTVWLQGQNFVTHSFIEGDVDYTWGYGAVYFQNDELKAATSGGFLAQVRNGQGQMGNVYVNCWLDSEPGVTGMYLARIDPTATQFPYSQVVFINDAMGPHIAPAGFLLNNATTSSTVQFLEYHSTDLNGTPLDVSQRAAFSRQISAAEAAQYSDPSYVLSGWVPYTVNTDIGLVHAGDPLRVTWTGNVGHSTSDQIGLYLVGGSTAVATQAVGTGSVASGAKGQLLFTAPSTPGVYEFRYTVSGGGVVEQSNKITVQ